MLVTVMLAIVSPVIVMPATVMQSLFVMSKGCIQYIIMAVNKKKLLCVEINTVLTLLAKPSVSDACLRVAVTKFPSYESVLYYTYETV